MAQPKSTPKPRASARTPEYPTLTAVTVAVSICACGGVEESDNGAGGSGPTTYGGPPAHYQTGGATGTGVATNPQQNHVGGATGVNHAGGAPFAYGLPPNTYIRGGAGGIPTSAYGVAPNTYIHGGAGGIPTSAYGVAPNTYIRGGAGGKTGVLPVGGASSQGGSNSTTTATPAIAWGMPVEPYVNGGSSD
jgi:hypothetical protein